jgi:hypothetical protein
MNSLKNQKNHRYQPGSMKITSDVTNLTTAILILTVQMFFEWIRFFKSGLDNINQKPQCNNFTSSRFILSPIKKEFST